MGKGIAFVEVIVGIFMTVMGIASPEEILGETILANSTGNPFYAAIWLGVKILLVLGFIALFDGIRRLLK